MIPFGEWLPDLPVTSNPGATVVKNVIPDGMSYRQIKALAPFTDALGARCQGYAGAKETDSTVHNFAGDVDTLYLLASAVWTDVKKVGGYSCGAYDHWEFAQWGDQILATQIGDAIQEFTMGTSSIFADLAASAPKAKHIAVMPNFVVVGNTWDSTDGFVPHRVRWSPIGAPAGDWTVSATTQADYEDLLSEYGPVQRIVGGENAFIFQEKAITRMTYVGSPTIFQFDTVELNQGTPADNSVVKIGNQIFYLGQNGFYIFDGAQSHSIGNAKVDKTFWDDVDQGFLDRVRATHDPIRKLILISYPGDGNTNGLPNKILFYNYAQGELKRWTIAEIECEYLGQMMTEAMTLEELDALYASLELVPFSLDSRHWHGGLFLLSAFNSDHKACGFSGAALTATIETQEAEPIPGRRSLVTRVRPIVDGTCTIQVGTRQKLTDSVSWSDSKSVLSNGSFSPRTNARYQRARVTITGGFDHAQGIDVEASPGGDR